MLRGFYRALQARLRDLRPGWDDEDLASALHKKRQAQPNEFVALTNRELQALKATGLWPTNLP